MENTGISGMEHRMVVTPPPALKESTNVAPPSGETAVETPTGDSPPSFLVTRRDNDSDSYSMESIDDIYIKSPTASRVVQLSQMANPIPSPESVMGRSKADICDVSPLTTPEEDVKRKPEGCDGPLSNGTPYKPTKLAFSDEYSGGDTNHLNTRRELPWDGDDLEMPRQPPADDRREAIRHSTGQASNMPQSTTSLHEQQRLPLNLSPYAMTPVESFSSVPFDCVTDAKQSMFPTREEVDDDDEEELQMSSDNVSPRLVRTLFGWVETQKHTPMKAKVLYDRDVGSRRETQISIPVDEEADDVAEEQKLVFPTVDSNGCHVSQDWISNTKDDDDPPHIKHVQENIAEALERKREHHTNKKLTPRNRSTICWYSCIIVVLLVVIAVASVLLIDKMKGDSQFSPEVKENEGALDDDDSLFPGGFFSTKNQFCTSAYKIDRVDIAYLGDTGNSKWDSSIDVCGDFMAVGRASWFVYQAEESQLMEASTCGNRTNFDTKITIASGSRCKSLTCVTFNDQACGNQSRALWYAEAGETYYINVHGFRDARGEFELSIQPAEHNDVCGTAVGPVSVGSTVSGTISGSTSDHDQVQCGDVILDQSPGVWYQIEKTDGWIRAQVVSRHTGFIPQISVYSGSGCNVLECEGGSSGGSLSWRAINGTTYYVLVNGLNSADGDFDLSISWEYQDTCEFATPLPVSGPGFQATTTGARIHDVPACGKGGFHTAPGIWFTVAGTGNSMNASTCGANSFLDSHISVFRNGCDALQCVASTGQDLPCGTTGAVTWSTDLEEEYLIYVSGRGSRVGDFSLQVLDSSTKAGEICPAAVAIASGNTSVSGFSTTASPLITGACGNITETRGMWYSLEGTGNTLTLSTCHVNTTFDARVSVFTGSCGSLQCEAITSASCSELDGAPFQLSTVAGENYFMLVHGTNPTAVGSYRLAITEETKSDRCGNALSIAPTANTYRGTTVGMDGGRAIACADGEDTIDGPAGVWYTLVGTGGKYSFSTCSEDTDFATKIHIFTGACFTPTCVEAEPTACGSQQVVTLSTIQGETYYIRVSSAKADELGKFVLGVSVRSIFMGF